MSDGDTESIVLIPPFTGTRESRRRQQHKIKALPPAPYTRSLLRSVPGPAPT